MEGKIKTGVKNTLEGLGIEVRPKPGRPLAQLAPGEEVWILGTGTTARQVLVTPFQTRVRTTAPERLGELPRLWVAEYLTTREAERLIAAGDGFVDVAGNAHVELPGFLVHVLGKPGVRTKVRRERTRRAWRTPALRALFRLLCDPEQAQFPVRQIAEAAGAAPGTIVNLFRDLEHTGNLVQLGGHKRRFLPDNKLADLWMAEYEYIMRPDLLLGRFRAPTANWWRDFAPKKHGALWGGEVAATLLGAELRPGIATLYTNKPIAKILKAARLVPDENGDVELRKTFWTEVANPAEADVVPPLLIVADLRATRDGRCEAAGEFVRERYLDGF
ncbi:MAG: hypothetical protein ACI8TQ_003992, partial [Planctomycetota bacterium]